MKSVQTLICNEEDMPTYLKKQVLELMRLEWPSAFSGHKQNRDWLNTPENHPVCVALLEENLLLSYAGVLWKYLEHAGRIYKAYGLSGVLTNPNFRGKGYGNGVVVAATNFMQTDGAEIGLFTCNPSLKSFYEGAGWTLMPSTPLIGGTRARPFPSDSLNILTMMRFFTEDALTHRASFENTPVYLELAEGDLW